MLCALRVSVQWRLGHAVTRTWSDRSMEDERSASVCTAVWDLSASQSFVYAWSFSARRNKLSTMFPTFSTTPSPAVYVFYRHEASVM